jgi:ribonuclease Y
MIDAVIAAVVALGAGIAAGFWLKQRQGAGQAENSQARAATLVQEAELEAESLVRKATTEARENIAATRAEAEADAERRREDIRREEKRLMQEEERIGEKKGLLERKLAEVDELQAKLEKREASTGEERHLLEQAMAVQRRQLEKVAQMTAQEAKEALVKQVTAEAKRQAMATVRELEEHAREEGEERARKIVTVAIQRVASEQTAETTVSVFALPSEDMKGRIIGREGRNIRAFEALTGVNLIIDDTPEAVVLSSFDPVRREAARLTLEKLVGDGRIHPARIEEMFERSQKELEEEIKRAGEAAVLEVGVADVHPEMIKVLGRLKFRSSYGQNVLRHLVESAHLAGNLASELGIDAALPKRCALMHDIGKALTHEVEGSHAIIGAELARRLKEPPEVVHAIESHHGEVEARTIEAVLAQTADQISGGRPGARRESLEQYVKRLQRLEEICEAYPGVEKTFAMQAGRDVRVMVKPTEVDDIAAQVLARDIAKKVEEELQYPGQIKITVVREVRAVEYAK